MKNMIIIPLKIFASICQIANLLQGCSITIANALETGGRLNKKDGLTRYGDSHVKDKTS